MEDSRFNIWDTQALARIGEVLEKLARLQVTDQGLDSNPHQTVRESYVGAFRYSVAEPSRVGPFQTIEALFPFLLFPSTQQYLETILQGLRHVLMELEESQDGGVRPFPEFESKWHDTAVDSTAFGLYVFALARNFFRTLPPEKRRKLGGIQNNVDTAIRKMIAYLEKNSNTDGWGFARGLANRVYSTALVATSLSYCEPGDFEAGQTHQEELIAKTVRYIDRMQIKEHKNHDESVQCIAGCPYGGWYFSENDRKITPNISAVAIFALNNSLYRYRSTRAENAIDAGVSYLYRCDFAGLRYVSKIARDHDGKPREVWTSFATCREKVVLGQEDSHDYDHPYHMIIPACLLTGELGYKDNKVIELQKRIEAEFRARANLEANDPRDRAKALKVWELEDIAFSLISYHGLADVIRKSDRLLASAGYCPACTLIQSKTNLIRRSADRLWRWASTHPLLIAIITTLLVATLCYWLYLSSIVKDRVIFFVTLLPMLGWLVKQVYTLLRKKK